MIGAKKRRMLFCCLFGHGEERRRIFKGVGEWKWEEEVCFLSVRPSWVDWEVDRKGRRGFDRKTEGRIFGGRKLMASSSSCPNGAKTSHKEQRMKSEGGQNSYKKVKVFCYSFRNERFFSPPKFCCCVYAFRLSPAGEKCPSFPSAVVGRRNLEEVEADSFRSFPTLPALRRR